MTQSLMLVRDFNLDSSSTVFVADTFNFAADTVDFVASVYGAKATRSTLSTFNKVDRVEFNVVASVYRAFNRWNST